MSEASSIADIRVLIAEDHPIMRQGLGVVLDAHAGITLVGEAEDGDQAVRLAQTLKPDVIIIDLHMPVKDGITAIREISKLELGARILVLTSYPDDDKVFQAIKAGAMGYFLKETRSDQLVDAIRMLHQGKAVLQPEIAQKLMAEIRQPSPANTEHEVLTQREMDILRYLARGYTNQEIADNLVISTRTVATHVGNILSKLHLANRTQAALYAIDQGYSKSSDTNPAP